MKTSLVAILLAAVCSSSTVFAADAGTFRIGTEGAYAPYNFINDAGQLAGFEIDLGNKLCERMKVKCEFIKNDWDSIIPNLVSGNYDAIMAGMSITDERKKTITFSDEYKPVSPSLYMAAKDAKLDFTSLTGKNIGVQGGTIQATFAEEKWGGGKNTIKSYEKPDQSVADLMAGNVDVVLADDEFIKNNVGGSNGELMLVGPEESIGGGIGIGMRQDDADHQKAVAEALTSLKADGSVDALLKQYFQMEPVYKK